jgi:hypothetical protein
VLDGLRTMEGDEVDLTRFLGGMSVCCVASMAGGDGSIGMGDVGDG